MRILAVADQWFPDRAGGSGRVAAETASRLAARGHEVTVLAPRTPGRPLRAVDGGLTVLRTLPRSRVPQTVSDVAATAREARRLGGTRFDVVVGHQVTNAAGLALGAPGVPLVLVYHASAAREVRLLRGRLDPGLRRASTHVLEGLLARLERYAVRRAGRVLVLSGYSGSLVRADHPAAAARVVQVSGGVDAARFAPADGRDAARARLGLARSQPLLLVVRRLEHRLGLEDVLEAVRRLGRPEVTVAIAGTGPLAQPLERLAAELGLDRAVRFLGAPPEDSLADWYRAADTVVLPPATHEGFGLATVEALASGTPVVASPSGATPELLGPLEPRLLADGPGPGALADAIARALALSGPELGDRCRRYALGRFGWDEVLPGWERALLDAAEAGPLADARRERPAAAVGAR